MILLKPTLLRLRVLPSCTVEPETTFFQIGTYYTYIEGGSGDDYILVTGNGDLNGGVGNDRILFFVSGLNHTPVSFSSYAGPGDEVLQVLLSANSTVRCYLWPPEKGKPYLSW